MAFSPDGKTVQTGSYDGTARLWEASSGQPIGAPMVHHGRVISVAYGPDGKTVLTGSDDKTARLWEASSGQPIGAPMQHHGGVLSVAFSPDGKTVLTGSDDKTARLWEASSGQPIGAPMQHQGGVLSVAFSPDGKTVLTGSDDKTARLWEASSGQPIGAPMEHQGAVSSVAYSPDGKTVLTGSDDKTARLWEAWSDRQIGTPMATARMLRISSMKGDVDRITLAIEFLTGNVIYNYGCILSIDAATWDLRSRQIERLNGTVGSPTSAAERTFAWHQSVVQESEQKGQWFAAAWHLDRMVASRPQDGSLYAKRGQARLHLGRGEEGLADFDQAISLQPRDGSLYAERGRAQLQLGRSDEALADFDRAISSGSEPMGIWAERGALHAKLGRWKSASSDFAKAVRLPLADPVNWYYLALSYLADGDLTGYRRVCSAAMDKFGESRDAQAAHWLTFTCVAGPDALGEPSRLVRLLEKQEFRDAINPRVQAAALYRAGRLEDALAKFQGTSQTLAFSLWDQFFLAMAHHRLGHTDEARRYLDEATKWIEPQDQTYGSKVWPDWRSWIELHRLRHEAEDLINGTEPNPSK